VATPVGDNAVYIEKSGGGLLAPVGDVNALGSALAEALGRTWDRADIASHVAQRSWSVVAEEALEFFHERLSNGDAANLQHGQVSMA
jgi:hypothetical protein